MKSLQWLFILLILAGACSILRKETVKPEFPEEEWSRTGRGKSELDPGSLSRIDSLMRKAQANGVMILNGKLVAEWNYGGTADQLFEVQSITKTITSVVLGLALKDGLISELDAQVRDYYPDFEVGPYTREITFRHLLTASSGIKSTITKGRYYDPDYMKPGIESRYHNDHCHQLVTALTYIYCKDLGEVLKERVLIPLRTQDTMKWGHHNSVVTCANGNEVKVVGGYAFSNWSARDLARVGYLYLNNGKWKGEQILPSEYTSEARMPIPIPVMSTSPDALPDQRSGSKYGLTWRGKPGEGGKTLWYMSGNGGQFCVVIPEYNLVMTKINSYQQKPYTEIGQFENHLWNILKSKTETTKNKR